MSVFLHRGVVLTGPESLVKAQEQTEACIKPLCNAVCDLFATRGVRLDPASILVGAKPARLKNNRAFMSIHVTICQVIELLCLFVT